MKQQGNARNYYCYSSLALIFALDCYNPIERRNDHLWNTSNVIINKSRLGDARVESSNSDVNRLEIAELTDDRSSSRDSRSKKQPVFSPTNWKYFPRDACIIVILVDHARSQFSSRWIFMTWNHSREREREREEWCGSRRKLHRDDVSRESSRAGFQIADKIARYSMKLHWKSFIDHLQIIYKMDRQYHRFITRYKFFISYLRYFNFPCFYRRKSYDFMKENRTLALEGSSRIEKRTRAAKQTKLIPYDRPRMQSQSFNTSKQPSRVFFPPPWRLIMKRSSPLRNSLPSSLPRDAAEAISHEV